jgi:SAM-dependent methyltransferase
MEDSERVKREKEWHNEKSSSNVRTKERKFYSVFGLALKEFYPVIIGNLNKDETLFLEYGCGIGYNLIYCFAPKVKKGIGIDISEVRVNWARQLCKEKKIENLEFSVMDAMNTSFEDNYFDIIHGAAILHHLDIKKSLEEINRILKNGGKGFFIEPLDTNPVIRLYRKMTPKARTMDEQPLNRKDIRLIKSIFPGTKIKHYFFLVLLAVPFRKHRIFKKVAKILFFMDNILLHQYSPLKWLAWSCTILLKKSV